MDDYDARITRVEYTLERHSDRLVTIEGRLANDYKSIMTLLDDVKSLREQNTVTGKEVEALKKKVDTLEQKMDKFMEKLDSMECDQKARDASVSKTLKTMTKWLITAVVISCAALIYSTVQNGTTASAITTLVGLATKLV